jgi:hypothetical protein
MLTTQSLKLLSVFALVAMAATTSACATETTDEGPAHLGTTTNGTAPVAPAGGDEETTTLQQSRLPILTKAPLVWEPVEQPAASELVVEVRPPSGDPAKTHH